MSEFNRLPQDPQFAEIDSFDMGLASWYASDLDPFDDGLAFNPEVPDAISLTSPISKAPRRRRRRAHGLGVDARRTARYRAYPIEESVIHRHLQEVHGIVTIEMLQSLITILIDRCPPWARPPAPTRNQRRVKGGLVAWLDANESLALTHLRSPA
jgi:hypothetical protein